MDKDLQRIANKWGKLVMPPKGYPKNKSQKKAK